MARGAGRPTKGYHLADGTRVPSVTTITGRFKDSGALLKWAWKQGRDGFELYEKRDAAADAGSRAHGWIEDYLHDGTLPVLDEAVEDPAHGGFLAFLDWANLVDLHVTETEVPLVSETHRYGGTLDCLAVVSGETLLLDWKTSSGVYPEYVVQLAAYRQLLRERDAEAAPKRAMLLRLGKEFADFHFHSYPEAVLDMGWEWFLRAREMYDLDSRLKKVAA